jgi:hypothetical protein
VEDLVIDEVVDLSAYGAVKVDAEPAAADESGDKVHELAEFGAVRID